MKNPPLILIRHAQAEHHVKGITGGWTDSHLTPTGQQQAHMLAERLKQELGSHPPRLVCSDLQRAIQTAGIISQALDIQPETLPELRDYNNGIAAGKTHEEARLHYIPYREPGLDWRPYPEAESWRQFFGRVSRFIERFSKQLDRPTIIVSHVANIHVIVAWWLSLPMESDTDFWVAPASITVLRLNRWNERMIERLNDTAHLYAAGLHDPIDLS